MTNSMASTKHATNNTMRNTTSQTYWQTVKLCLARPDGSAEIHHQDGRVERIRPDGWRERDQVRNTAPVTGRTTSATPTHNKEVTAMVD